MNGIIKNLYQKYLDSSVIVTDSRNVQKHSIFFALKGEKFDGNNFAIEALENGCDIAVVDHPKLKKNKKCFFVPDVLKTLQELAKFHRSQLNIPVIGITGTNGKTTTKELVNTVLSKKFNLLATKGNLNNHIGVPLTILSIQNYHEIAVIEMGANHVGEIDFLCRIAQPTHGIITNIGKAHLEGFKNFEGIIQAKSELYQYLKTITNSVAFVNKDHAVLNDISKGLIIFSYGTFQADCTFTSVKSDPFVEMFWQKSLIKSKLIGNYNAENIMAAVCIGCFFKVKHELILEAIQNYSPQNQRSEYIQTLHNEIILDAYNANPSSMNEALESFKHLNAKKPFLILGDMFELGDFSIEEHQKILKKIISLGFKEFILIGHFFNVIANNKYQNVFQTTVDAEKYLKKKSISGRYILIKGSRGMKLESLIPFL